jgi:hypothetical protein
MDREQDLEPVQDIEEIEEVGERINELFGDPSVPPSFYHCKQCDEDILAQDIVWDREGQPRCPKPKCNSILERRSD